VGVSATTKSSDGTGSVWVTIIRHKAACPVQKEHKAVGEAVTVICRTRLACMVGGDLQDASVIGACLYKQCTCTCRTCHTFSKVCSMPGAAAGQSRV
jgi:hypothetical protein